MKYIIELEDEPYMREDGVNYYTCKSARWYKLGETIINRLTPYTEPDRKAIEDAQEEAWEFAKKVSIMKSEDKEECWGTAKYNPINFGYSYSEAKARYEAWKKQKEEIHVGDEVEIAGTTAVVVRVPEGDEKRVHYISPSGTVYCNNGYADIIKTGRHFDEVERLLERIREQE